MMRSSFAAFVCGFCCCIWMMIAVTTNAQCPPFTASTSSDASASARINLTDAMNNHGAMCLDGSVPVIYFRKGTDTGMDKFHVYFEGSGFCAGLNENEVIAPAMESCYARRQTQYGSSNAYPAYATFDSRYLSTSRATNPVAYNWNTVYVKYCDGGAFSGANSTVSPSRSVSETVLHSGSDADKDLHFRGFSILNGVFAHLDAHYAYANASQLLVSGCDSGALAVFLHSDYIYHHALPPPTAMNALADSGFYLEYEGSGQLMTGMRWIFEFQNASASLNDYCLESFPAQNQSLCMFPQESAFYSFIPTLALQSVYDSWQLQHELVSTNAGDVNAYGRQMQQIIENSYLGTSKHFIFLLSCSYHGGKWNDVRIDGFTSADAQIEAFKGVIVHDSAWVQNKTYPCPSCC